MPKRKDYNQSWMAEESEFDTTQWTKILGASLSQSVMGELYRKYRKPVYLYLRGRRFSDDAARDLIQAFFTDKVLGRQLFKKADPKKGKFRTFLLTSIRNYAIDIQRSQKPTVSLDDEDHDRPARIGDPAVAFNRAWAMQLIQETLQELEAECRQQDKQTHWELFRQWLLDPDQNSEKTDMTALCTQLHIKTPAQAYTMIFRLKDRFRAIFRGRLRSQGCTETEVDQEIRELLGVF
ncbi:RNA polymerase sigma factor [Planctomycetota bacterium]